IQVKLEYMPIVLGLFIFVKYVHTLYPKYRLPYAEKVIAGISLLFALFVLLTPAIIYTKYLALFLVVTFVCIGYFCYIFIKAFLEKRVGAIFSFIGFSIFIISILIDGLFYFGVIHIGGFSSHGFVVFLVSQLFGHAFSFSKANQQVEQ